MNKVYKHLSSYEHFYGFEKINSPESENVFIKKHPALKSYLLILSELVKQRHFIIFIS